MPKLYCSCYVFDTTTKKNRKCKLKPKYTYDSKKYCHVHINNTTYVNSIIKIQSVYKGYIGRKLVKKYNCLPEEVQRIICKYTHQDIYYYRYCEKISTIIINKAINFIKNYYLTYLQCEFIENMRNDNRHTFETLENINYLKSMFKEIIHIFYLIDKYISILNISKIKNYQFDGTYYSLKYKLIEMSNLCLQYQGFIKSMVPESQNYSFYCVLDLSEHLEDKY